jgi:hypothetical protein
MAIHHGFARAFAITPSDTDKLQQCEAIFVGGAGDVIVQMSGSTTSITFTAPAGAILPIKAQRVMAATTATALVGLWGQ